ncbi:MBL fold metallo-hydrolase [Deinococcus humi]|uniref:Glyoxylase-like metal-dependent hydrolase (Beta-lactamase superfamily II) n=1 Tax=Deinococcus humi TaxID=662880 RepID=A0A7W8JUE9_9DEIO|nr:MBL fold metallo-hydrolase [Deinococcus humi]MBB5363432.1 glyoxylase-like metal-dependent hydrolase (beta-lactamase superfamily II) [Deinococcus humi]GGO26557.1 hypothetical protein GCM10008949_17410 [Deinococcus humi]
MNESPFNPLADDVFALAVWDEGWGSYNNCYLLVRGDRVLLIDTGKAEHFPHLQAALATLGKTAADVTALIATHGHPDHIGSAHRFTNARKYIHPNDVPMLTAEARELFTDSLPDHGDVQGLTCWLWGDHTPGSCVLYDGVSHVTFAGDPICFFGQALPQGELVERAPALRETLTALIAQGELWRDPRVQPERFQRGVAYLSGLDTSHFATGHGVVLHGDLKGFFSNLIEASNTHTQGES